MGPAAKMTATKGDGPLVICYGKLHSFPLETSECTLFLYKEEVECCSVPCMKHAQALSPATDVWHSLPVEFVAGHVSLSLFYLSKSCHVLM